MMFERLRVKYRPNTIRLLLVGEAPPLTPEKFFYSEGSTIARRTEKAFVAAFGSPLSSGVHFLPRFKQYGFFLDDICHAPVLQTERMRAIRHALPGFSKRLREYRPKVIIVFIKRILSCALQALNASGLEGVRLVLVPPPFHSFQKKYVAALTEEFRRSVRTPKQRFLDLKRAHRSRFEHGRDFDGDECVVLRVQYVGYEVVQHLYFGPTAPAEKVKQTDEFLARIRCDPMSGASVSDALDELNERYGPCVTGLRFQPNALDPVSEAPYPALHSWWQSG